METTNNFGSKFEGMKPGELIKQARENRGWSQNDLAKRVKISQPAIKKIESGETQQTKFLPKIAEVLELDIGLLDSSLKRSPNDTSERMGRTLMTPDGARVELSDVDQSIRGSLAAAMQGRKAEVWRIDGEMLQGARYHPGDFVVVDLQAVPKARDIVLAEHNRLPRFRLYLPPYLYTAALTAQPQPLIADGMETIIRGVVISRHSQP